MYVPIIYYAIRLLVWARFLRHCEDDLVGSDTAKDMLTLTVSPY